MIPMGLAKNLILQFSKFSFIWDEIHKESFLLFLIISSYVF